MTTVYPRVCGGTLGAQSIGILTTGLSPRVRGNQLRDAVSCIRLRSIPACAGEPLPFRRRSLASSVYPRVCGGTRPWHAVKRPASGLSPRVRGNRTMFLVHRRELGSIPACAGEPIPIQNVRPCAKVYPRVCGGTSSPSNSTTDDSGLSPRVRGNLLLPLEFALQHRSIPACAGEPFPARAASASGKVYPRVCGGTAGTPRRPLLIDGLSPRVRGNLLIKDTMHGLDGSIPACAGEPRIMTPPSSLKSVYPRVCGGTWPPSPIDSTPLGLSPRVRGNRHRSDSDSALSRSIPACAGEPRYITCQYTINTVYPRVCGGTGDDPWNFTVGEGLSPRVRGNPRIPCHLAGYRRSIPRVCGGTLVSAAAFKGPEGLSPRVRGNLPIRNQRPPRLRSIPACAGEPLL